MPVDLQALYPRLIHLMLDTVFVVDRDNQIVFVSDACEALLGYQACELIGTPITDYMHPDDLAITRASIVRVMSGHPHYDFRNRYIRKDGGIVHILWAACWSDEADARIGVARDITAQRQAEDELRFWPTMTPSPAWPTGPCSTSGLTPPLPRPAPQPPAGVAVHRYQ